MKLFLTIAGAAAITLGLGACAYDPYHSSGTTRTAVSASYGYGHGYGGNSFSTSFFWSTGDPRWGYDPYSRAYFDYNRRAYYDPYLYGYYPVGYRPPILVGVPHPSGYRRGWCPPPRRVTNVTVVNYRNREAAYRRTNHRWAQNVRYDRNHRSSGTRTDDRNPRQSRNDSNRWDGRTRTSSGAEATRTRNTGPTRGTSARDNRNRGQDRGSFTTPPPRQSVQPTPRQSVQPRSAPTRQPVGAGPQRGARESIGADPRINRRPATPPQRPRQNATPRSTTRSPGVNASNRGGRQPQRAATAAPRGRENAARPPQRGNSGQARPAPQNRPSPPAAGGRQDRAGNNPGRGGGDRSGRGR